MQFTVFTANCVGKPGNCSYPKRVVVTDEATLKAAVAYDHVCAEYQGNYRNVDNFLTSDCLVMDLDNDHSEDPAEWITPEKLMDLMPDVDFMMAASRHHMLPKDGKPARPRFHVYFPIEECVNAERYAVMKAALHKKYSFFDGNALDAARFIFGCDCETVVVNEGWVSIDEEIDLVDEDTAENEPSSGVIAEGSRNNTMSHFAGRVLKRFGVTEKARNAFMEHKEYFLCRHGKQLKKHSKCCTEEYSVKHVDTVVWNALKELLSTLEWLGVKAGAKAKEQMKAVKVSQKAIDSEIEKLKAEKIRQYELYADSAITKEQYLRKKKELSDKMEKLETDRKEQAEEFDLQSELWESASNLNSMAKQFSGEQKLTRQVLMAFIENVYIYDPKRIEIVFQHEDEIARLVESLKDDKKQAADTLK